MKLDPADFVVLRKPGEDGFTDEDFWNARPELAVIRDGAWSYGASPWATLAYILLLIVDQVPPWVVLPPIVGGYGSLNLYFALVGATGAGKNTAMRAAKLLTGIEATTHQASTGQGIVAGYIRYDAECGGWDLYNERAIWEVDEIDKYAAYTKDKKSTLDPTIRSMWNGDAAGDHNATVELRRELNPHTYRFGFCLGVQPAKGEALMSVGAVSGGTTGRFGWLPTTDPTMPPPEDWPEQTEKPMDWQLPALPPSSKKNRHGLFPLVVCAEARDAIARERWLRATEQEDDEITAHALLVREKFAAGLGVLNGHWGVRTDDWHLAGYLMTVSDRTRGKVVDRLQSDAAERNRAQGRAQAEREITAEAVKDEQTEKDVQRVSNLLMTRAAKGGKDGSPWVNRSDLRAALASRDRKKHFDDAVTVLVDSGQLLRQAVEHHGQQGEQFRVP